MSNSPFAQSKESPSVSYQPIDHPHQAESSSNGQYQYIPMADNSYKSPALSSPGMSSITSGGFKSLDEVKNFNEMKNDDDVMKSRIRKMKFLLRLAALVLAIYMIATMSLTLHKFFTTRNILRDVPDPKSPTGLVRRGPWAKNSKTWPTTVLLCTSAVSFLISAIVMASYVRGVQAANTAYEYGTFVGFGVFGAHVGMWIAVAAAYRAGKSTNDLWGWTCDEKAMKIQEPFEKVINFRRYCDIQTSSWATSLLQAILLILYVIVYGWGYIRLKHQRKMQNRFSQEVYGKKEGKWTSWIPGGRGGERSGA